MLLIVLFILVILVFFILKNANRNKYINIIALYLFSTSMILLFGLLYKSRITQYSFPVNLDYVMYTFLRTVRMSVHTLSRLYNLSFALFMASGALCVLTLDLFKYRKTFTVLLMVPIAFFVLYNDPVFYRNSYIEAVYYNSYVWSLFIRGAKPLSKLVVYSYITLPFAALVWYHTRTRIFTKRRDSVVYGACLFAVTVYIVYVCFFSVYKDIIFWNVDIARLPLYPEDFKAYMNVIMLTFVVLSVIVALIVYYEPFNTISIINLQNKKQSKKEMEQNFAMVLHEYKNAFIGVKHYLNLADSNLQKGKYKAVQKTVTHSLDIIEDNLESINRLGSTIGFHGRSYQKTDLIRCLQKALANRSVYDFAKVKFDGFEDEIHVFGDEKRLTEVFENLFLNSVEALGSKSPREAVISIDIIAESDAVMITVTDNGIGIKKKDIRRIFSIFYSTKSGNNSGVGLNYVVKELQSNNGEIRAVSEYGSYTSMQIVLPIYKERRNWKCLRKSKL